MSTELMVALISGAVALSAGVIAVWGQIRTAHLAASLERIRLEEQRKIDRESVLARYREPLARAAYDLQSRLYNILQQGVLNVYFESGDERECSYFIDNTAFLIAQYFAWTEIIRRDIQYIDLGEDDQTRQLACLQEAIYALFQTDRFDPMLRVFAGEQRALGERMIRDTSRGPECAGYAAFMDQIAAGQDPLIELLREDVRNLNSKIPDARPRLVAIQAQ